MGKAQDYEKRTEELLIPILEDFGYVLWDVSYDKQGDERFLRVYIDKEGGITIDDCVEVSRKLSDALDADDLIEDAYTLEVSSPGLGRKLVKDREFDRSIGRDVDIKFYRPVDGSKEITGQLEAYDKDTITIVTNDKDDDNGRRTFERSGIATVKLSVDL